MILNPNVDVSMCLKCAHFILHRVGYVLCDYWKYQAQMATYFNEQDRLEYVVNCPIRINNIQPLYGGKHGKGD